jgi:hypothetical protein
MDTAYVDPTDTVAADCERKRPARP